MILLALRVEEKKGRTDVSWSTRNGSGSVRNLGCLISPGGGVFLYEVGTPDLGLASAGRAALAEDASTVMGNPAGMSRLDRHN